MNSRLFQRDFSIMILGQIISLFGNSILRFSLSLYVLDVTGSAAVFGTILAVSMIPTLVLSPFGGVLADRLPKQKIMAILDFVTAGMIVSYDVIFGSIGSLAAVAVFMILLTLIPCRTAGTDFSRYALRDRGSEADTGGQCGLLLSIGCDGAVSADSA